ncbi:hypothetical protein [Salinicola socius]|uniref:Uncharacterized protein n=1 Tax=Salinicola socius TaxID=404433 RepID=A0A1Q8ST06_9GAMM|nr:hypothetical protein [Salinicola socius]OLO04554.1 hypothetical protein BTW07_08985 [Salinicola socius]
MKISGRIKALIIMAVVVYVLAHVVRAMLMTLLRSNPLLHPARRSSQLPPRTPRLERDDAETLKHCTRC